jgi:hypothetical protein
VGRALRGLPPAVALPLGSTGSSPNTAWLEEAGGFRASWGGVVLVTLPKQLTHRAYGVAPPNLSPFCGPAACRLSNPTEPNPSAHRPTSHKRHGYLAGR